MYTKNSGPRSLLISIYFRLESFWAQKPNVRVGCFVAIILSEVFWLLRVEELEENVTLSVLSPLAMPV